jgi:transcriptional regulator with XRE-family HTH domain
MNKLKKVRLMYGLSQKELAERSGVSLRLIQAYEQNYKDINKASVMNVLKLAAALDCGVKKILG